MSKKTVTRRTALKSAGAFGALAVGGVGQASAEHGRYGELKLTIVPRELGSGGVSYTALGNVEDAIEHFFDQIESHSGIYLSTTVDKEYDSLEEKYGDEYDFTHDGGCCDSTWFDNGIDAIKDDLGSYGDTDAFLLVTSKTNYAGAMGGDDGVAYTSGPGFAWVGTEGGYDNVNATDEDRYMNASIQETGHTLIDHDVIDEGPSGDKEHALGRLKGYYPQNYRGPSTPMITFYESSDANPCDCAYGDSPVLAGDGECSSNVGWDGYVVRDVTECTLDAIRDTIDQNNGY